MAFGAGAPDISFWLGRKYALLQQQADAGTQQAATGALVGKAAAGLDTVKTNLLPKETLAGIAKTNAETSFLGEQQKFLGPEATARIANLDSQSYATRVQGRVAEREGLMEVPTTQRSISNILGARAAPTMGGGIYGAPIASRPIPNKARDLWTADELDRYNGL